MHHCLQVPELAFRIAEACVPGYRNAGGTTMDGYKPKLGTLCAFARTCRAVQEPALDVLWYFQFGLQNLVKCMPGDLWEINQCEDPDSEERRVTDTNAWNAIVMYDKLQFKPSRTVTHDDWERFDFYAKRVRKLECAEYYVPLDNTPAWSYAEPSEYAIQTLQELKGSPLLPNVRSICWTVRSFSADASFNSLKSLLTPNLTTLQLICERNERQPKVPEDVITALSADHLRLQCLHLKVSFAVLESDGASLSLGLRNCDSLQELNLDIFERSGFGHLIYPPARVTSLLSQLCAFPKLHGLRIMITTPYTFTHDTTMPFRFPSVKVLSLSFYDSLSIIRMLDQCEFPSVTELSIGTGSLLSLALLSTLSSKVSYNIVHSLKVRSYALYEHRQEVTFTRLSESLQQLLVFCHLRYLDMKVSDVDTSLNDTDLERFVRAWPHLHRLQISYGREQIPSGSLPTYRGLASLVRLCPHLDMLALAIAATPALGPDDLADLPTSMQNVVLDFYCAEVGDLRGAASWVAMMFPHVLEMRGRRMRSHRNPEPMPTWQEVGKLAAELRRGPGLLRYVVGPQASGSLK